MMGGGTYSVSCKVGIIEEKAHLKHQIVFIKSLNDGRGGGIYKIGYYVTQIFLNHGGYLQCGGGYLLRIPRYIKFYGVT